MAGLDTLSRPLAQRIALLDMPPAQITGEPDIPENVIEAAGAALDRGETHYTDRPGIPEMRALVAERLHTRYGLKIDPAAVTITCGSTEARFCTVQILTDATHTLICPGDSARIEALAKLLNVEIVRTGEGAPQGSVIYLTPADDVDMFAAQAVAGGWWVIWDVSGTTAPDYHPAQTAELTARVVMIDDLEAQMPGWGIGWMAGSEKWSALRAAKQALTICTPSVAQWAALELMRSNDD